MAVVRAGEASSSSTSRYTFQVFLSFRGKDTRKTFTDHHYTALVQAGIRTFRDDDEIERGEDIKSELQKAIKESKISIIVFSKDYASSKWCLDELVMILHRKRTSQHVVFPVFYDVHPSEVRNQLGAFAEAFGRYEEQLMEEANERENEWMEKVKGWREALKEVANLAGMELQNQADGHESKFIQKTIKVIEHKLSRTALSVAPHLIGIDSRAEKMNLWVQDGSMDVGIIAICGMGGIGKTTIAKYVYNLNFERFEGSSFLANIREASEQPNGLVHLQRQLLSDILRRKTEKICNVDEGIIRIKDAICCKRVLVVLDDVDQEEQLGAILRMQDGFCPGSKIIITTRHEWLLKPHGVYKVHKVKKFDAKESFKLFSWHAFGQDHPIEAYMEHSRRVVHHCEGLPLALQVLGSSLSGKSVDVWKSAIEKLDAIPNSHILKKLKISYDSLQDDHDQDLFLHIACFFIGELKDFTVKILDQCDFYTTVGIQNLIDRSLLIIDVGNTLMMHQLIQEMGREIIRQESPKELGKRSRLWRHMDSFNVLKERRGTKKIEGLILDMQMLKEDKIEEVNLEIDAFARMKNLRVLKLNYVRLTGCYEEFPKTVRWLCWHAFPLKNLPSDFPLESVVALDLSYSSLERAWKGTKLIGRLKILNLSHCHDLAETPDFSGLPNLERLILEDCVSLIEIHESIGNLERLVFLNLRDCKNLRKLPKNIVMLKFLETLNISGCSNIVELPGELKKMESLKELYACGFVMNQLVSTTRDVKSWPAFNWFWALLKPRKSPEFFSWASLPSSLVRLGIGHRNLSEDAFPRDMSNLSVLKELDLSGNPICSLPDCIKGLSSLELLCLYMCGSLQSLIGLPNVKTLMVSDCTTSLKKITYQSALFRVVFESNPDRNNPYGRVGVFDIFTKDKVDEEMIKYMGLFNFESMGDTQVKHQYVTLFCISTPSIQEEEEEEEEERVVFGIFSTFVPEREAPDWLSNKNKSSTGTSSISFTVPSHHNLKILGLDVYSDYALISNTSVGVGFPPHASFIKISNKTKNINWIFSPICHGIPEEDDEDMVWFSHWEFGNEFEGGDEVHILVSIGGDEVQVKGVWYRFCVSEEEK